MSNKPAPRTIGDVRAALKKMPEEQRWSVPENLKDEDPVPTHGLGARTDNVPLAKNAPKINFKAQLASYQNASGEQKKRQQEVLSAISKAPQAGPGAQAPLKGAEDVSAGVVASALSGFVDVRYYLFMTIVPTRF